MALLFEHVTCSRCGGTGRYSYCSMHGSVCFKCNGQQFTLTKRGAAAQSYFRELCSKPAGELVVGDRVTFPGCQYIPGSTFTITKIEPAKPSKCSSDGGKTWTETPMVSLTGHKSRDDKTEVSYGCAENYKVKLILPPDVRKQKIAEALAYQDTLTKQGTVSKRAAKKKSEAVEVRIGDRLAATIGSTHDGHRGGSLAWAAKPGTQQVTKSQLEDLLHSCRLQRDALEYAPQDSCTRSELAAIRRFLKKHDTQA